MWFYRVLAILLAIDGVLLSFVEFDWRSGNKSYFYDSDTSRVFQQAQLFCESHNSTLVQIRSRDEQLFLNQNVRFDDGKNGRYWIGAEPSNETAPTKFIDGTDIEWFNWSVQQPDENTDCIAIFVGSSDQLWWDSQCSSSNVGITVCERLATPNGVNVKHRNVESCRKEIVELRKADETMLATIERQSTIVEQQSKAMNDLAETSQSYLDQLSNIVDRQSETIDGLENSLADTKQELIAIRANNAILSKLVEHLSNDIVENRRKIETLTIKVEGQPDLQ